MQDNSIKEPSKEEFIKFLKVTFTAFQFEAQQRQIRGYGAFKEEDLPVPEVVAIINWIKTRYNITEEELKES